MVRPARPWSGFIPISGWIPSDPLDPSREYSVDAEGNPMVSCSGVDNQASDLESVEDVAEEVIESSREGRQGLHYHRLLLLSAVAARADGFELLTSSGSRLSLCRSILHSSELNAPLRTGREAQLRRAAHRGGAPLRTPNSPPRVFRGGLQELSEVARTGKDVSHILQYNSADVPATERSSGTSNPLDAERQSWDGMLSNPSGSSTRTRHNLCFDAPRHQRQRTQQG